jgi:threonine synthase
LAGLLKHIGQGKSFKGKRIVCIVTGNGLKDPDIPTRFVKAFPELPADLAIIEKHLGLKI